MDIKIIIFRRYSKEKLVELQPILDELYRLVFKFGGFVSGETLVNIEEPGEHMIISTWNSIDEWEAYHQAGKVKELCGMVDIIIGQHTSHKIFRGVTSESSPSTSD